MVFSFFFIFVNAYYNTHLSISSTFDIINEFKKRVEHRERLTEPLRNLPNLVCTLENLSSQLGVLQQLKNIII
jgi:hypothetical protein